MPDVDAVNSGYARVLLEQYLENPEAVPSEWRALFESGDGDLIESLPGLARLLENRRGTNGHAEPAPEPAPPAAPEPTPSAPDEALLGGTSQNSASGATGKTSDLIIIDCLDLSSRIEPYLMVILAVGAR